MTLCLAGESCLHVLAGDLAELPEVRSADTGECDATGEPRKPDEPAR